VTYPQLQRWLPGTNAGLVAAAVGVPVQEDGAAPWASRPRSTDAPATLVLAVYLLAFTVVAAVLLQRRDIT
jgi:hypothetical protein